MPRTTSIKKGTTARKKTATRAKSKAPAGKKAAAKKKAPAGKKTPAKKAVAKKPAPASRKTPAKKTPAKKQAPAAKKAPASKPVAAKGSGARRKGGRAELPIFEPYQRKRGEEYMNDAQLNHFKEMLLKWKAELMQEVDRTVNHMKDEAANFPDPADRATQEEEFSLELRTRDRERKLIKKIDATIELIEQNDYGYCEACGVEIGIQRLEARPTATQCIDCKTLAEIKEKQELG